MCVYYTCIYILGVNYGGLKIRINYYKWWQIDVNSGQVLTTIYHNLRLANSLVLFAITYFERIGLWIFASTLYFELLLLIVTYPFHLLIKAEKGKSRKKIDIKKYIHPFSINV